MESSLHSVWVIHISCWIKSIGKEVYIEKTTTINFQFNGIKYSHRIRRDSKHTYLTHRWHPNKYYQFGSK